MKFKLVATTLGLAAFGVALSVPAYAANDYGMDQQAPAAQSQNMSTDAPASQDRAATMENALAKMTQNSNRTAQKNADWSKYIRISGGMNVDAKLAGDTGSDEAAKAGSTQAGTPFDLVGTNTDLVSINDAFLNIDTFVNNMTSARLGLSYNTASHGYFGADEHTDGLHVDEAYLTFANFKDQPWFVRAGKQYVDFGSYKLHPITRTMTQAMSETNAAAVTAGVVGMHGFSGDVTVLSDGMKEVNGSNTAEDSHSYTFGASVSHHYRDNRINSNVKASYLNNMTATGLMSGHQMGTGGNILQGNGYRDQVGAVALNANVTTGPFDFDAAYVSALKTFNDADLAYKWTSGAVDSANGAKPSAWNIGAGYSFRGLNKDNRVSVGYGQSNESSSLGLPEKRFMIDMTHHVFKNTAVTLEWAREESYGSSYATPFSQDGSTTLVQGNGDKYNVVTLRGAVNFG